jgi:hypothetical protein
MLLSAVCAYAECRDKLLEDDSQLNRELYHSPSEAEKTRRTARAILDRLPTEVRGKVYESLELRQIVARRCVEMRSFAKLDAFDRRWPTLGRMLRADFSAIRNTAT